MIDLKDKFYYKGYIEAKLDKKVGDLLVFTTKSKTGKVRKTHVVDSNGRDLATLETIITNSKSGRIKTDKKIKVGQSVVFTLTGTSRNNVYLGTIISEPANGTVAIAVDRSTMEEGMKSVYKPFIQNVYPSIEEFEKRLDHYRSALNKIKRTINPLNQALLRDHSASNNPQ